MSDSGPEIILGSMAVSEARGLEVIKKSYGRSWGDPASIGHRFTIGSDGTVFALVAGDMGYDATHITIPKDHILALAEQLVKNNNKT